MEALQDKLMDIDIDISYAMFKNYPKGPRYRRLLKALEWSGHGIPWFMGVIISLYLWPNNQFLSQLLAGLLLDILVVAVVKALTRRRRPLYANQDDQMIVASVDKHSMPSGHASRAVYFAILSNDYSPFSSLIWLWAFAVGLSRIFLGRHHVFDVAAGFAFAFFTYTLQFSFGGLLNRVVVWILLHQFSNTNDINDDVTVESVDD